MITAADELRPDAAEAVDVLHRAHRIGVVTGAARIVRSVEEARRRSLAVSA